MNVLRSADLLLHSIQNCPAYKYGDLSLLLDPTGTIPDVLNYCTYCYAGNSTEIVFFKYKYVGFNIPCPKRVVFRGINSTQSRIHSRNSTGVFISR